MNAFRLPTCSAVRFRARAVKLAARVIRQVCGRPERRLPPPSRVSSELRRSSPLLEPDLGCFSLEGERHVVELDTRPGAGSFSAISCTRSAEFSCLGQSSRARQDVVEPPARVEPVGLRGGGSVLAIGLPALIVVAS